MRTEPSKLMACPGECKPRRPEGCHVYSRGRLHRSSFVFQRRGEEAHRIIRSRPRRAAEKQKKINWRAVYKHGTPPGFEERVAAGQEQAPPGRKARGFPEAADVQQGKFRVRMRASCAHSKRFARFVSGCEAMRPATKR